MISRIALALTIAAISTSASAQTNRQSWQDLLKPHEAKTNPNVPIAPPQPAAMPTATLPGWSTTPPAVINTELLDACIITATGRLPKADGLRVINSSYEFGSSSEKSEFWRVFISVDLHGRQATYHWTCHLRGGSATLHNW